MTNLYQRKLEKIFNQVDKLAAKGKDNKLEYLKYIDELIGKGDYSAFGEMLYIFYQIDISTMLDVPEVKAKTWDDICFQTKTPFMTKLSKLYKKKGVYQQGYNIYTEDLGKIQISLSDKLTTTFSATGFTPSISFVRSGPIVNLEIYDININSIQIQKSEWGPGPYGNEYPLRNRFLEDLTVSYLGNSFTEFNPSQLTIGQTFSLSVTTTKQFISGQLISVTYSNSFIEGNIQSYDKISGDTLIEITDTFGSLTYSLWNVKYLSGPKGPSFSTNIPTSFGANYWIKTYSKDDSSLDYEIDNYKLSIEKNPFIGQIYETEIYTPDVKYLMQNKQYAKIIGERRFFLEAIKDGATFSKVFDFEDPALSVDANLLNRYSAAIDYLLS